MSTYRGYLTQPELEEFADIVIDDTDEADDRIGQAEELVDQYAGFQEKAVPGALQGLAVAGSALTITLETNHQSVYLKNFFLYCVVELIGGTGQGQTRRISGSTYEGVITVDAAWGTVPDSTTFYKIYQLGKFPRARDEHFDSEHEPQQYYRSIPEKVRRAVAAQVQFMIEMGDDYFSGDKSSLQSESLGDYSYSRGAGDSSDALERLIAPKAKILLRGLRIRTGKILV